MFLGDDLLVWLVLALGGALFVGNVLAVVRPPGEQQEQQQQGEGALERAPLVRSLAMAAVGLIAALWALASLLTQ